MTVPIDATLDLAELLHALGPEITGATVPTWSSWVTVRSRTSVRARSQTSSVDLDAQVAEDAEPWPSSTSR